MHSSTSSSSERIPARHGIGAMVGSLIVFIALLTTYEYLARSQGFEPAVRDSMAHWSHWRQQVESDSLVFVGDSRITAGIDLEEFKSELPDRNVVQLGIDATQPLAVLDHMLADEDFRGVIVCSFSVNSYAPANAISQKPWIDYYKNRWTLSEKFSYWVKSWLDGSLAMRRSEWGLTSMISTLVRSRALPEPPHRRITPDRSRILDFSTVDTEPIRQSIAERTAKGKPISQEDFLMRFEISEQLLESFMARGGKLVYVVMPLSGEVEKAVKDSSALDDFWGLVKSETNAETISYEEFDGSSSLSVPDGSHLDVTSRSEFSRQLLSKLKQLEVLE